jgi:signal transduction histidine kinase
MENKEHVFTLGIEEEFQIIDPETRELRSHSEEIIHEGKATMEGKVKPELHQSIVELGTEVCADINAARRQVVELRSKLAALAARDGSQIASAGTHPFSRWKDQPITKNERYATIVQDLQQVARTNVIFGLHVHVAERHGLYVVGEAARIINHRIDEAVRLAVMSFAAQQALIRKDQQDEHLAFIAHDLRTPLNAVSLLIDALKAGLDAKAITEAGDLFEIVTRNLNRVEDYIKKVLDLNLQPSATGSSFRPERRTFELWPLVQRLILDLRSVSSKHDIEVLNEIPRRLTMHADAGLISQVFQNLLGNAFKYAASGRVVVSANENGDGVNCVVHDNGAGIPLEMLAKVFDRSATDPEKEGAGLGLAIVKQIVDAHDGTVTAESTHGAGATFSFTIPAGPTPSASC